jgi:hypothetical protein
MFAQICLSSDIVKSGTVILSLEGKFVTVLCKKSDEITQFDGTPELLLLLTG